jgi:hypothetical protein
MKDNLSTAPAHQGNADWFARITAVIGLLVALAAVVVPYVQGEKDKQERLTVVARPEEPGVIRLAADESKSRAVQVPWVLTLSNSGRTKLSILSYRVAQLKDGGLMSFPGLDGGMTDRENKMVLFPFTLDGGESISVRLYLGFEPTPDIQKILRNMFHSGGALDSHKTFLEFAEKGLTIYGGKASMTKYDGGNHMVTIDSSSTSEAPTYNVTFLTGRNQEFSTICFPYPSF